MGWISTVFAHKAIRAAGGDQASLFRLIGLDDGAPPDPSEMIPDTTFFGLLERIAGEVPDGRLVPLRLGAAMRCDDYGAFGLAFKSAPDLMGSYRRVERYGKVVTSIANFRVVERERTALMEVIPGETVRLGLVMTNELAVSAAMALSREVAGDDFAPEAVHLAQSRPNSTDAYHAHFRCPVHFEAERDALEVGLDVLDRPNRLGDAAISAFFERHLDEALEQVGDPTSLRTLVLDQISGALSEGVPTLADVAARLTMSSRTLQRRLSEAGLAYQDLVAEARQTLADRLLRRTDYALAEIAFLTGFSDQSTFTRAFKRWSGQTPAEFRRNG